MRATVSRTRRFRDYLAGNEKALPSRESTGPFASGSIVVIERSCPSEGKSTVSDLVKNYLACWNETDPAARRALIDRYWSADASYVDPLVDVRGREALDATIAAVQGQFPGFVFWPAGPVDAHHDVARLTWGLGPEGSAAVVVGFDVVVTDADGRIEQVLGFLDRVPG
jgi:hypothetical protein